nr:serine hydrolase [Planosporangium thailandense]
MAAALGSLVLASTASVALVPSDAGASPAGPRAVNAARPPFAPCPMSTLPALSTRPPRPAPPSRDPARPVIGGEGLATAGLTLPPGVPPPPANKLSATSWVVADLDSGAVLGACAPHELSPPASIQKLLLVAAVMPRLDPAQVVEVTQPDMDFEPDSSLVGLVLGGHYSVETLWLGLLLNSGNDAANVLARLGGGDAGMAGGVKLMNDTARRLGALDTHAATPSGLDGPGQFTSAYDMALIARACFTREDFRRYASTRFAAIPAQPAQGAKGFEIGNDNNLFLNQYPGALGGKIGFTDAARHTYVGAAERNGRRLVVTLLGGEIVPSRGWQQGVDLLDWGFSVPKGASVGRLVNPGEIDRNVAGQASTRVPVVALSPAQRQQALGPWTPVLAGGAVVVGSAALVAVPMVMMAARRRRAPGTPGPPGRHR